MMSLDPAISCAAMAALFSHIAFSHFAFIQPRCEFSHVACPPNGLQTR